MTAFLHDILARQKPFPGSVCAPGDFQLGPAQAVAPELAISSPDWSLYCLDFDSDMAMFVELPTGTNLAEAPFAYGWQFERAKRAIMLPLDALPDLAEQVSVPPGLGMLFSTGRCGSTLASRILAQIPGVWSLSEPDCLTNLAFARFQISPERATQLIRASVRLLSRPPAGLEVQTVVIKPRSEAIIQAAEYGQALPDAQNVFMYRDVIGFVRSLYRFAQRMLGQEAFFNDPSALEVVWGLSSINSPKSMMDPDFSYDSQRDLCAEITAFGWVFRMETYLKALKQGAHMHPLHYDDLNRDRRAETAKMLTALGVSLDHLDLAMRGFEKDAHSGTAGENTVAAEPLNDDQIARINKLMGKWGMDDYGQTRLPAG